MTGMRSDNIWWVRLWSDGPGLQAKRDDNTPLFSERMGYRRFWRVPFTRWRVRFLASYRLGQP